MENVNKNSIPFLIIIKYYNKHIKVIFLMDINKEKASIMLVKN